jgi:hypothetical protein
MLDGNALPTTAEAGPEPEIAEGGSMVKIELDETMPSVVTVMVAVPGFAIRLAEISASSSVALL